MTKTLEEVIYKCRWVDGIKDQSGTIVSDAGIAEAVRGFVRQAESDAWERGMADAKLQMLGVRPLVRNPYLED